jgi:hypothetical protein
MIKGCFAPDRRIKYQNSETNRGGVCYDARKIRHSFVHCNISANT